ncbi:MAG: carboxylesterase family protein [Anaerolineaceae bacterium]|nr:carboxylesterase family protein [Anaerolineaceae bacterium]
MWIFLLIILSLLFFTTLELGKHTLLGWILGVILVCGFVFARVKGLNGASRWARFVSWAGLIAWFAIILWISKPPIKPVPAVQGKTGGITNVIHLPQGDLTGVLTEDGEVEVYAGIPYAEPPVGDLRWREPVPAKPWSGVLAANHFAPMSMQVQNSTIYNSLAQIIGYHDYKFSFDDNYREPVSEDSLYLNIWKPAGDVSGLPVLVYIHGGALQTGQPWYQDYSGLGLAHEGVIVVNMGYRLGIFGFLADPELAAESPNGTTGNYGLLDQILALQWVQDNIAAFGGDPGNVTISGESAGSACVSALSTSPLAKGLFRRVVGESSTVTAPKPAHSFRLLDEAYAAAADTKTRYKAVNIADLRAIPAEKLASEMNTHHHITIDGYVLPETPYESYAKGIHNEEAQMHGFNRDESAPFILFSQANLKNYEENIRTLFPEPYASRVLELYPAATDEEAKRNWAEIYTVFYFTYGHYCWERQALANGIPSYVYYFTKQNGRLSAWHSGEEVYLYGNIPQDSSLYNDDDRTLSDTMMFYFKHFITGGDPNGHGLPAWPVSTGLDKVLELNTSVEWVDAPYLEMYSILDEMYGFELPRTDIEDVLDEIYDVEKESN